VALRRKIQAGKADLDQLADDLVKANAVAERTRFWVSGFRDVRLFILDDVLDELEWTSAAMLEEVGLTGWQFCMRLRREQERHVKAWAQCLRPFAAQFPTSQFEVWCGGEGQRLRLVGALALADVLLSYASVDCTMEILDEPTRHLSSRALAM